MIKPEAVGPYGGYQAIARDPVTGVYCRRDREAQGRLRDGVLTHKTESSPETQAMPRSVRCGLVQTRFDLEGGAELEAIYDSQMKKTLRFVEDAAGKGVQILCLQEIFTGPYFCAEQDRAGTTRPRRSRRPHRRAACRSSRRSTAW